MQHRNRSARDLRSLPPHERAEALRQLQRERLPHIPRVVVRFQSGKSAAAPGAARRSRHGRAAHSLAFAAGLLAAATLALAPAHAARAGALRLDVNLASIHTERWARDGLNQRNPGVGIEYQASRTWAFAGGVYTNSYRKPTAYALAEFAPLHIGQADDWHLDAGVAAGVATGYTRAEIPCAPFVGAALARIVAPDGAALNIVVVPNMGRYNSGFVGFQVSVPLRGARSGQ